MDKTFAILGSGMQGTAVAYDLAHFANPVRILMGDANLEQARHSACRVNNLVDQNICHPEHVNALDSKSLQKFLEGVDVVVSCVPYWMHPKIAAVAIQTRTNMLDLGGNTDITRETLGLHAQAKAAGITIVPDTGLAPGLVISVAAYFIESLDHVETIKLYCGGLPQHPKPPFNYKLSFNIEGLVTEYSGKAITLRNGEIRMVDTLKELETLRFEELGALEAFTTSGGVSTAPYTWQGKVNNFEYKTLRYPGHCQIMRIFKDCGFWNLDPIELDGQKIRPRDVFHKLMGEALKDPTAKDLVVVRGIARGHQKGISKQLQIDILEKHDDQTGFSAMERLTGFSSSIYAIEIAQGNVKHGCIPYEKAVSGKHVLREIQRRGVRVKYSETELE